ncbi:hypothetical protein [Liquorilactobacillus mali]|uniref:hypothetical protein n=1 Tax=Liquorilactobacillus mali TaxID=1618 RepID=UPI0023505F58|nr:hypothetical protein [Liquorilactobacillus mali]MDC7953212.1 hypothetical protein [Liquorilactobacillus mali]
MREIESIEIENPYRYRGYMVGESPMYDVQNFAYVGGYEESVTVTKIVEDDYLVCGQPSGSLYRVFLSNDDTVEILDNQPGIIVTHRRCLND